MSTPAAKKPPKPRHPRARRATYAENSDWVGEHYDQLLARYPEQWIAVQNRRVIASDPSIDALVKRVPGSLDICFELMIEDSEEPYDDVILIPGPGSTRPSGDRSRMQFRRRSPEENEKVERELRALDEDCDWLEEHYQELLAQYPEQWVAVKDKRIIATDPDLTALRAKVPDPEHTNHAFLSRHKLDELL